LAHHYTEAGLTVQAVDAWQHTGERAIQHSAYVEAISHFTTGLALLGSVPDTPEQLQHELALDGVSSPGY
jgi:predicted ATPase